MSTIRGMLLGSVILSVLVACSAEEKYGRLELVSGTNVVSLGDYPDTEDRVAHAQIKNVGKGPLRIKRVLTTCNCMRLDSFPEVLAPDETGTIAITILRNMVSGSFVKVFFIESDEPTGQEVRMQITGTAKPLFTVTANTRTAFGSVEPGTVFTGKFTVVAAQTNVYLDVPVVLSRGTQCTYTIRTNQQEHVGYEISQVVTFSGNGFMESTLLFPVRGQEGVPHVRTNMRAGNRKLLRAIPEKFVIPRSNEVIKRRIQLINDSARVSLDPLKLRWETGLTGVEVVPKKIKNSPYVRVDLVFPTNTVDQLLREREGKLSFLYDDWSIDVPILPGK